MAATLAQQASARWLTGAGALIRSPRSVEALGRVDVVCFDKTGTLSENRLRHAGGGRLRPPRDDAVLAHALAATPPANGGHHEHATDHAIASAATHLANPLTDVHLPFRSGGPAGVAARAGAVGQGARRCCWRAAWTGRRRDAAWPRWPKPDCG